jgi:AcrR family transcriptional regulator
MRSPYQPPGAREKQRDHTRTRLYDEALAEFKRVGFAHASVSQIASHAGVSRASFYFHFPTKEHVLLELQWRLEVALAERLRRCRSLAEVLAEMIEGVIACELEVGDLDLYRDMLGIYTRHPRDGDLNLDEQTLPLVTELGCHFADALESGDLRPGLEPAQAAHLFLAGVYGYQVGTTGAHDETRADLRAFVSLFLATDAG